MAPKIYAHMVREGLILPVEGSSSVKITRATLIMLLRPLLLAVKFDEAFYRRQYPDLAQAEAAGRIKSLHEHYLEFGYFENRMPCFIEVDGAFYGREYPDVAAGILDRTVKSTQWHFETFGFIEGRLPRRAWSFSSLMSGN